jgi:TolB protein
MAPHATRSPHSSSRRVSLLVAALAVVVPRPAAAQQQGGQPPPQHNIIINGPQREHFAVPECVPKSPDSASREACHTFSQVLKADIQFEDIVDFVPEGLLQAIPAQNADAPNLKDYQSIGASYLVTTRAEVVGSEMNVEAKVYFVATGQNILAKRYSGKAENPRLFAHQASDDIMGLTTIKGVARSKIAFVSDRDSTKDKRTKELYIVDYDGFNPRRVTVNRSLNILPAWSPDGRTLAYVSYRQGSPDIYLAAIYEGKSTNLTSGKGFQAFAPAWSPDGTKVAYASNRSGNMEIWISNADGSGAHKITASAGSNTAPCWSPTGQEIAFTSSRSGAPQIYLMDSEGLNVRRLTTVGSYNDAPAWNPSKLYGEIAYTSRLEGASFEVAVIDLASRQVRQVTEGRGSCEYPAWAPNGRHLVFACNHAGTWQLTVSDRDGRTVRTIPAGPGSNAQPDWSP